MNICNLQDTTVSFATSQPQIHSAIKGIIVFYDFAVALQIPMSNLNKRKSENPCARRAKKWIDQLLTADCTTGYVMQLHILKVIDKTGNIPTLEVYEKLLPTLRKEHHGVDYPSVPKCTKKFLNTQWTRYLSEFNATGYNHMQRGNGNSRDATSGRFTAKPSIKISNIASNTEAPVLPNHLLEDLKQAFVVNSEDHTIDLGQSDVISYGRMKKNTFSLETHDFFSALMGYAANKIVAFNEGYNAAHNKTYTDKDVTLQIIRYRHNAGSSVGGLSGHYDVHNVGSLVWVVQEIGCKAIFEYKDKVSGVWNTFSKEDGYTSESELIMINNIFHRVVVVPDEDTKTWSRIVFVVNM